MDAVARGHLRCAPDDRGAVGRPADGVAAAEHRERAERFQPAGDRPEAGGGAIAATHDRRLEPAPRGLDASANRTQPPGDVPCLEPLAKRPELALARVSVVGFEEARALAAFGGAVERQGPTREALDLLTTLRGGSLDLEVEYAATAIRAAISAAQDERPELDLLLTHARDLTERLAARQRRAVWPRPFNVLAGELWLEVDRFEEARAAFERAVAADATPIAITGLARTLQRLGRRDEACRTFARLPSDSVSLRESYRQDFAGCR